jgi:hypothetical protein
MGDLGTMKVAVVSDFRPGYDVGLEVSYARALETLGHSVARVSLRALFPRTAWLRRVDDSLAPLRGQRALRRRVEEWAPDVVFLVKALGVLPQTVRRWRAEGARVVNVFPDNPFDAAGANALGFTLLQQLQAANAVFIHDRFAVGQLHQVGVKARFLAFARDPEIQRPESWGVAPRSHPPVVFVGNPDPERIRYLRAIADLGLGLWGNWSWAGLGADDPLTACVRGREVLGAEMVRCLHHAQVSVNVLRPSQKTAHNMRTFEAPASRACPVSEASPGVLELMKEGREVLAFSTPDELRTLVKSLLASPGQREELAAAAWERVREDTYATRAAEVLAG